jgi:hypothetical protein
MKPKKPTSGDRQKAGNWRKIICREKPNPLNEGMAEVYGGS